MRSWGSKTWTCLSLSFFKLVFLAFGCVLLLLLPFAPLLPFPFPFPSRGGERNSAPEI